LLRGGADDAVLDVLRRPGSRRRPRRSARPFPCRRPSAPHRRRRPRVR
jgi:hypothetical protein